MSLPPVCFQAQHISLASSNPIMVFLPFKMLSWVPKEVACKVELLL